MTGTRTRSNQFGLTWIALCFICFAAAPQTFAQKPDADAITAALADARRAYETSMEDARRLALADTLAWHGFDVCAAKRMPVGTCWRRRFGPCFGLVRADSMKKNAGMGGFPAFLNAALVR